MSSRIRKRFSLYAAMLYVGLATALVVADQLARRDGIDPTRLVAAFLVAIPLCLAGARALAVILDWRHFRARPGEILRLSNGGAAIYGGLPPLLLASVPLARWVGVPLGTFWDAALVSILAGTIPGRFGCLGAGCCAGRPTTSRFGLLLLDARGARARRYPSPLLEALLGAALLAGALLFWGRLPFHGALALAICAAYGAGRIALEELREEPPRRFAGLGPLQWMSAALVVLGVAGLAAGWAGASFPRTPELASASESPSAFHLIVSGILLLPVVGLFRFVGCHLVFGVDEIAVRIPVHLLVLVPDMGTGPASVRMEFRLEPGMEEIPESPVFVLPTGTAPDGRLQFETIGEVPQGAYTVTCIVSRDDALTRVGSCSGTLDGPDLVVQFVATAASGPTELNARFCFEAT